MNERDLHRGKRKKNGMWIVGWLFEGRDKETYIKAAINNDALGIVKYCDYIIDPDSIGQCTGMRDRNEAIIYVGDVAQVIEVFGAGSARVEKRVNRVIKYSEKEAAFMAYSSINSPLSMCYSYSYFTVIGNIHDNPELLEVQYAD